MSTTKACGAGGRPTTKRIGLLAAVVLLSGCAARWEDYRSRVSAGIEDRIGRGLRPAPGPAVPDGVSLADGLSEEEAVAVALWNNAEFHAGLAELGLARADLIEAGLLHNPVLSLLFPWGPKQLEFTATWPVETLWQRPRRVAVARLGAERVAENLVQHGLNLARDARIAHADLILAQDRARLGQQVAGVRRRMAELAEARLLAGDGSALEASAARAAAQLAEEPAARFAHDVVLARDRLRSLLGLNDDEPPFQITCAEVAPRPNAEIAGLVKQALAARPDLRAAELAIEAAGQRAGLERSKSLAIAGILDANQEGKAGFEAGPGIGLPLLFFQRNAGGKARAEAELDGASRRYLALRRRIVLEVEEAHARFRQAEEALRAVRGNILPALEEGVRRAEKVYQAGEESYLVVLENTLRFQQARRRELEAAADLRRASAALDRSVGKKS